ncbi:hypothetical protein [Thiolapillus sp.]
MQPCTVGSRPRHLLQHLPRHLLQHLPQYLLQHLPLRSRTQF